MENFRRCRICISESAVMMSIFGEDALWKKITYFANVEIEEDDSLPQQICVMCVKDAINAYSFKQKCEKADRFFRKQLRDGDAISVSSGEGIDEEKDDKKFDKFQFNFWNISNGFGVNSPILVEDSNSQQPSESNEQHWTRLQDAAHENNENLPLIPEIELITPCEDDKKTVNGYQCSICFEFFAMKSIIKHHIKIKHPEANPTYECFECKKKYLCKRFLDKHIRRGRCVKKRKNQSRVMKCPECHEVFPSGHHLGWHKRAGNCPSKLSNIAPVSAGPEDSDSEEENLNKNSTTEKIKSPKPKINNRRKWGKRKHKGRVRGRLDANKIELAKELIKQDTSTTKLAEELQISRTHAWKLRKSLDYMHPRNKEDVKTSNSKQENNLENNVGNEQQALNLSVAKQTESENQENNDQSTEVEKTQENGQANSCHTNESEEEDSEEGSETTGEETESADESRQDDSRLEGSRQDESLQDDSSVLPSTPQPGCSKISPTLKRQKKKKPISSNDVHNNCIKNDEKLNTTTAPHKRKPRKPNVFMTPEKYEQAKQLVSHRATTMEVAKQLNISQMSAWKLRDNIIKGIPMTFKSPPIPRPREPIPKVIVPRQKLQGMKRFERDKQIKEAILGMIREDNSIQYWKVSEKLAEKGIQLSASSVCQRLKRMGIHRRWKPIDCSQNDTLKSTTSGGEEDNSSSLYGTTDTSQFLTTSFSELV